MYPELIYPMATMVTPRVCVSPTPSLAKMGPAGSHDDLRRDDHRNAAEPVHRLRCSYPSLSPKCSLFRDVSLSFKRDYDSVYQADSISLLEGVLEGIWCSGGTIYPQRNLVPRI